MKKYAICFGTRPEYLKLKSLIDKFKSQSEKFFKIIFIQQHISILEDIDSEWTQIEIQSNSEYRLPSIGSQILSKLPIHIEDCTDIIVQGDTATAFYSALCGFQMEKRIIHIEAGLRTYNLENPFPEESYRQMISRIATLHFTPHDDSTNILKLESVSGKIYTVGNTILDLIKSYNLPVEQSNMVLITYHRRENWGLIENFIEGLQKLISKNPSMIFLWYIHPNPDLQMKVKMLIKNIPNLYILPPSKHNEFCEKLSKSLCVITDSGGIQEEATFLGKKCFVLRKCTERNHIPSSYIQIVSDFKNLDNEIYFNSLKQLETCTVYGNGNSSTQIFDKI